MSPTRVPGREARPPTVAPRTVAHQLGLPVPSRVAHLRAGLVATALAVLPALGIGAAVAGVPGALGALGALAVVAFSFVVSTLAVAAADRRDPALTLPVALVTYVVKVVVLGVVAFAVADGHARWHAVTGWTVLGATVLWVSAHAWWFWHAPRPYVSLPPGPPPGA